MLIYWIITEFNNSKYEKEIENILVLFIYLIEKGVLPMD